MPHYDSELISNHLNLGILDGYPAKTKAGELSIVPKEIQILAPCMKLLPTTGLADQSFKYRHRHVSFDICIFVCFDLDFQKKFL